MDRVVLEAGQEIVMNITRFFVIGLSMMGLVAGCAAEADDGDAEPSASDSAEVRSVPAGYCQSTDGVTVLGTSCHRKADLLKVCQRQARPGEEAWNATANNLRQDGKWKTATCSIDARKVTIRCCDDS